ncbi:MAG TPA: hypothetical protein VJZ71_10735 [Phycisphaerae bacterium]|nr:hypothetical protein [Phycisphaerae bacterium]
MGKAGGRANSITGADAGGSPHTKVFSGTDGAELLTFFAYDAAFTGGVRVGRSYAQHEQSTSNETASQFVPSG